MTWCFKFIRKSVISEYYSTFEGTQEEAL